MKPTPESPPGEKIEDRTLEARTGYRAPVERSVGALARGAAAIAKADRELRTREPGADAQVERVRRILTRAADDLSNMECDDPYVRGMAAGIRMALEQIGLEFGGGQ